MDNGQWTLPSGMPIARRGLCMLAQPSLRQPQRASGFRFMEATILLVKSGSLSLDTGEAQALLEGPSALMAVARNVCADLVKLPGGDESRFRSLLLAIAPEVLREFYKRYDQEELSPAPVAAWRATPLDDDLADSLEHCIRSVDAGVSQRVLMHRLVGLLLALADRGIVFARPASQNVGDLLTSLLSDAPGQQWTAAKAGRELAMSEATLRRRLAAQHLRFETLLLEVRMHHAMGLLQTTGWSIPLVAEACGYQAHARFSLRFRERFGCPPSHVR
ncbi:helix-turn-helix transcriptional regulator [Duganella sp. S19_KUP01_CR8]|uniref:helix-turn-helix transcriptional regulator n=1 Tax=Duganella sp. S19_KUP01_CR8 TaxID=3025502 RepID=UPI002FCD90E8